MEARMGINDPATKVSLILISISWCDVYLTILAAVPQCPDIVRHLRLKFLSRRCFIQRHQRAFHTNLLPVFMHLKCGGSSSGYRNLHTIHADFGLRENGERPKGSPREEEKMNERKMVGVNAHLPRFWQPRNLKHVT